MALPSFPDFVPVELALKDELEAFFRPLDDGICENTFASLFLASRASPHEVSRLGEHSLLVKGTEAVPGGGVPFARIAGDFPAAGELAALLSHPALGGCRVLRDIPEPVAADASLAAVLPHPAELDRDNCDYLYRRSELAELKGKAFHKKKNLLNQFNAAFRADFRPLDDETAADALLVLDAWAVQALDGSDEVQCRAALRWRKELGLYGFVLYADGAPAAFSLGEELRGGTVFDCHFEKALESVHGSYQAVNAFTARALPERIQFINREQDLGNAGLRQAKLSYRPCAMVEKFRVPLDRE